MGHLTPELPPQHFNWVEPGAVGGQVQPHQTPRSGAYDRFDCIIVGRTGIVPGEIDGAGRMFVDQALQPFSDFPPTLAASEPHDRFARLVVDRPQSRVLAWLTRRGNHHLLALQAPHGAQGGHPAEIECVGIVKHRVRFPLVASLFNRLF
jgi:hypothetical protein